MFGHLAGETSLALTVIVYKPVYVLCGILILVLLYRQNVVIVGAGRSSRSAKFVTSSELLYLLNLLYNTPSECCDEYKLIQLYQNSSVWCFAFSHTSTFELIPAVATAQPGALVTEVRPPRAKFHVYRGIIDCLSFFIYHFSANKLSPSIYLEDKYAIAASSRSNVSTAKFSSNFLYFCQSRLG